MTPKAASIKVIPERAAPFRLRVKRNPFITGYVVGFGDVQAVDVTSRLDVVKRLDVGQLYFARKVPGLQSTVRAAINRRLRSIEKAAAK